MTETSAAKLAKWTVELAEKAGADQVSVGLSDQREINVEYRKGQLEKLQESTSNSLSLNIYVGHRFLSSTTSNLDKDSLKALVSEAITSAKYLPRDENRLLPDSKYYPKDIRKNLKIEDRKSVV